MNRNRTSLAAAILAAFLPAVASRLMTRSFYKPVRQSRSAAEQARLMAAAQAKRERRRARNIALLRAEQARKGGA